MGLEPKICADPPALLLLHVFNRFNGTSRYQRVNDPRPFPMQCQRPAEQCLPKAEKWLRQVAAFVSHLLPFVIVNKNGAAVGIALLCYRSIDSLKFCSISVV